MTKTARAMKSLDEGYPENARPKGQNWHWECVFVFLLPEK
jgi:hypothetical protein